MLGVEPVVEQGAGSLADAGIATPPPAVHLGTDAAHQRALAGTAPRFDKPRAPVLRIGDTVADWLFPRLE